MNLPLTSLNNHTGNTFNRNINDSNQQLLSNRTASTMLSPQSALAQTSTAAHSPMSNEHLYSTLYGRELELMRKIYKGENRDHLVENPMMQSPHHQQQHNADALLIKNAGYPLNYSNPQFGIGLTGSQYHHALSPPRTPPKMTHHQDPIMSPDNTRMIKQEDKSVLFNSPPSGYGAYGASAMSPTSILSNMGNPIARKFDADVLASITANQKQLYEDRKMHLNPGFANKEHPDQGGYGENLYADVMNASNSSVNNFLHLQQEQQHEKQPNQRQNTTKHMNNTQLIGTETNSHFYNISDYESNDKRPSHHSSHQLFQQNQFSINNTPKDNSGANVTGMTEKSPINNTSKLNNACSHSDTNNNNNNNSNNDNAKNIRMATKFSAASSVNENAFDPTCRPAKMCNTKSIKSDATSKINPSKVNTNNNATNLLPHSKCGNETTNDFMLHIRVKEQKQQQQQQQHQLQNAPNGRMAQQIEFEETSNSCDSPGNEDTSNYNDDEGDEFMNL